MKHILKPLGAFALSLVLTLALAAMPARAVEIALDDDFDAPYAGYLVVLGEPAAVPFSADPFAAATLMAAESEREELLMLAENWNIYKAGDLSEIQSLVYSGQVTVLEPDYQAELFDVTPVEPNDPRLSYQTNLIGDKGVAVRSAWEAGLTGDGVTVAVIDSGLNGSHEDVPLKVGRGRYFYFKKDPDGRYELEVKGKRDRYSYWSSGDWSDSQDLGHGSMVSGIIAAPTGNGTGIASIAPGATILPIRCFTTVKDHVGGFTSNLISGLDYAVANGADIINMSWGIKQNSSTLKTAIDAAYQAGCILIAAAGNDGEATAAPQYPAAWDNVISVGATDNAGRLTYYSQRVTSVDVCAPGGTSGDPIVSLGCASPTSYLAKIGTSFSCPQVAAAAALLLENDPTMTQGDFLSLLRRTSHPVTEDEGNNSAPERYAGAGRMDIQALLDAVGYAGCATSRGDSGLQVYASYHPVSGSGTEELISLVAGYNAQGHLVESHSARLTKSAYNNCAQSFTFTSPDVASLRAFYLDPTTLVSLAPPVSPIIPGTK